MKQLLSSQKKILLISVISLIILSFSFLITTLSIIGIYYIPTFTGWWPLGITFIVIFILTFISAFVMNIIAYRNSERVVKDSTINNNETIAKNEKEEIQIQTN